MRALHIDIETFCELDITKVGMFEYVRHESFEIILFSYRFSDELFTTTIDLLNGEELPKEVVRHITRREEVKKAWNVFFEYTCLKKYFKQKYHIILNFFNWYCTMTKAAYNGYPLKLESSAIALKLSLGKMAEGRRLVKEFCTPITKPTKKLNYATRKLPHHSPERWELFKKYNNTDVEVEVAIDYALPVELPPQEYELFVLDYRINERGIRTDLPMIRKALELIKEHFANLFKRSQLITGLDNPNSPTQLMKWLQERTGLVITSVKVESLDKFLSQPGIRREVKEVIDIRKELSLSSVKKYAVMLRMADVEGIIRGITQFYGANRTGRWAGRGVQVHNLPKQGDYNPKEITFMRKAISPLHDCETLTMLFSDVLNTLKLLLRTAFVAREGHYLLIADWSAIEARILAWLSNCKWRMEVFATHGKIYEASAAKMLKVPIELIKKPSKERDKGKVAELALGYQGWVPALVRMGALEMGLSQDELAPIAMAWRNENPEIAHRQHGLWARCERAFIAAFEYPGKIIRFAEQRLAVQFKGGSLIFTLPSSRQLFYPNASYDAKGKGEISYWGIDQTNKKWKRTQLYGGKIVENAVQAIARDILAEGLKNVVQLFPVVMHVHDEIVAEVPEHIEEEYAIEAVEKIMNNAPSWANGLILKSDIFTSPYYRKN